MVSVFRALLNARSVAVFMMIGSVGSIYAAGASYIGGFNSVTPLGTTVPSNGDVNPYGVALVPVSKGKLIAGNFLVSNFNNSGNAQGTGTTIVQMTPTGAQTLFAQINPDTVDCPGGVGLTTALVALRSGFVVVGSLPTSDGTSATAQAGCLLVLDWGGNVVETIVGHHINGPWDMTAVDGGEFFALFVTNVLNGTVAAGGDVVHKGTIVRMFFSAEEHSAPRLLESSVIANGFPERTDPAALVIGPTGVAFDWSTQNLYVADSLDNRIAVIPFALTRFSNAGEGFTISRGGDLNDPLGLALTPNHHLVAANGNDGNIVEVNPANGKQVAEKLADSSTGGGAPGAGALFGLIATDAGVYFVDDATNMFDLLH
ncbi:MAG: hypothetical protein WCC26_15980 [Terracidiphilus sp.]